jgi:trimeric autotransporter adhesin
VRSLLLACSALLLGSVALSAQSGFVRSGNQPIPGATLTATQGEKKFVTVTDGDGHYTFPPLSDGNWTVAVEMFGFTPLKQEVNYFATTKPVNFSLQLQESPMLQRMRQFAERTNGAGGSAGGVGGAGAGGRNAQASQLEAMIQSQPGAATAPEIGTTPSASAEGSDSLVVQGSLSQGLNPNATPDTGPSFDQFGQGGNRLDASNGQQPGVPGAGGGGFGAGGGGFGGGGGGFGGGGGGFGGGGFGGGGGGRGGGGAQQRGQGRGQQQARGPFGNRRQQSQIRGQLSFSLNNSIWDAKPFSITGQNVPQPAYAQSRFSLNVGGPLVIPHLVKDPGTFFFLSYFGTRARNPYTAVETVPTDLQRMGDFSQTVQSKGSGLEPVQIFNRATNLPYPNNVVPSSQISPIALGLLPYIPLPNQPGLVNNYQYLTSVPQDTDNLSLRVMRNLTKLDRLSVSFSYQRRDADNAQPFQFLDTVSGYGLNATVQWTHTFSATLLNNAKVIFNRNYSDTIPYFANGPNVAAELGIQGTSTNAINYGPPTLNFTNFGALSDGVPVLTRNQSQDFGDSVNLIHGKHSFQFGLDFRRNDLATNSDSNGRGTFNFTGEITSEFQNGVAVPGTGYDFADFLLGYPQSSSIRYGEQNTYFYNNVWSAYAQDTWQPHARLSLILGLRYEYFSPFQEKYNQMANLDVSPNFSQIAVVLPNTIGPYSGYFPAGLVKSDYKDFSPRLGLAWKVPHIKRSTLIRAGYGIYYNGQAYYTFPSRLASQPPFATASSANTTPQNVLTLAEGFVSASPDAITNTYAANLNYQTPYAQTWSFSIQHDLPKGIFVEAEYLGTKGTHLDVSVVPNQGPPGTYIPPGGPPSGYIYDSAVGNSSFNALNLRAVQRFRRGISFNAFYRYSKSIDDSSTFGGVGNTVAQNWQDISAERGLSSFDRRQYFVGSFVLTSPIASGTSHVAATSWEGRLLKDWTLSGSITAETGTPLTARILGNGAQLGQTGGVGSTRADATGESIDSSTGLFNLLAFTVPPQGVFGNAGRNTIEGPGLVSLNLAFARAFQIGGESRRRLEFRFEANNALNQVNYTGYDTVVNAINYGLASAAGSMRSLNAVVRFRF